MYDFAHCLSDSIEGITHSLCTLEFVDHRALYDWILDQLEVPCHPQQIEFARLNLSHTVMSKRILRRLVEERHVSGWDDPRMPTLSGMRRRGYPPAASAPLLHRRGDRQARQHDPARAARGVRARRAEPHRAAADGGAAAAAARDRELSGGTGRRAARREQSRGRSAGTRNVPFTRELYIERDDFLEDPPKKFFRLAPGREVRLRYAYFVTCTGVVKDAAGEVVELRCRYDPATRGGDSPDGRKVKGTLHWVSAAQSIPAEVRLYETLFSVEDPMDVPEGEDFTRSLNPSSLEVVRGARLEPALAVPSPARACSSSGSVFLRRPGRKPDAPVWTRTVTLRDTWAKVSRED